MGDEDNEEEECLGWDTYRNKEPGSIKHLGGRSYFFPEWGSIAVSPGRRTQYHVTEIAQSIIRIHLATPHGNVSDCNAGHR